MYTAVNNSEAITYSEKGINKIYNFFSGRTPQDAHILYVDYWDGSRWQTASQGSPVASRIISTRPAVVSYSENGIEKIFVFVQREDKHIWTNWWDGAKWQWIDHGMPTPKPGQLAPEIVSDLSAATVLDKDGYQQIFVFGVASDHHLWILWFHNNINWNWVDRDRPGSAVLTGRPTIVVYRTNQWHLSVFVSATDNHVYASVLNGAAWHWEDQGSTGTQQALSAVTYPQSGLQRIYVFAAGADNHLRVNWYDGTQWHWADQGVYNSGCGGGDLSAITYLEGGLQRIYAFTAAGDGHLRVNWWDGSAWHWADEQNPGVAVSKPSAITYREGAAERIYVFATGANHLPYVRWWSGSQWAWYSSGPKLQPPLVLSEEAQLPVHVNN